jgi:hypothetical protein
MRRVGLIGELVTSLHQPFLTLLRTEANKDGRGWGGAFAVRNGRKNESPLGSAPNFGTPNGLLPILPSLRHLIRCLGSFSVGARASIGECRLWASFKSVANNLA